MSYLNCITGNDGVGSRGKRRIPERMANPNWEGSSKAERLTRLTWLSES
ncbi:hypothetical protein ACFL6S_14290 [Candidatus Poribacteria bacterium]